MNKLEIKSHEYKVSDITPMNHTVIYTRDMNDDIVFSLYSTELQKVGLARQISEIQLKNMLHEMNYDNIQHPVLIMRVIGGQVGSTQSKNYVKELISWFMKVDETVNIVASDICDTYHPNSCEIDCFRGKISELTCLGEINDMSPHLNAHGNIL